MSRSARPISVECDFQTDGKELVISRWVEATKIILKIRERRRVQGEPSDLGKAPSQTSSPCVSPDNASTQFGQRIVNSVVTVGCSVG